MAPIAEWERLWSGRDGKNAATSIGLQPQCSGMAIIFMKCTKLAAPESRLTPSPAVLDVRHSDGYLQVLVHTQRNEDK